MVASPESKPHLSPASIARNPRWTPGNPTPRVSFKILLLLTAGFWLFVTLTDVLYGYTMQINAGQMFKAVVFVNSNERVLQHLLLFPILLACFAASLRIGWTRVAH